MAATTPIRLSVSWAASSFSPATSDFVKGVRVLHQLLLVRYRLQFWRNRRRSVPPLRYQPSYELVSLGDDRRLAYRLRLVRAVPRLFHPGHLGPLTNSVKG